MKILPKVVEFDWDQSNLDKNLVKHNVTNKEAEEIFDNKPNFLFEDDKHSIVEKRYMIWGITNEGRKLTEFFTIRNNRVRIISARDMHKKERREYEKKVKINPEI